MNHLVRDSLNLLLVVDEDEEGRDGEGREIGEDEDDDAIHSIRRLRRHEQLIDTRQLEVHG